MAKLLVAQVPIGFLTIEGLMSDGGEFFISVSQAVKLFNLATPNHATKAVKALLGKDISLPRKASELNSNPVNVLTLEQFYTLTLRTAFNGNTQAQEFLAALSNMALAQLFSDAFGRRFDAEDRQIYLKVRALSKVTRRTLTDAIKEYLERNNITGNLARFMYSNVSDCLNRGMFGHPAKALCKHFQCHPSKLRDCFDAFEILEVERVEDYAIRFMDEDNLDPMSAMKKALGLSNCGKRKKSLQIDIDLG